MLPSYCHRARAELAKIFAKIIATRRATGSKEDDMLQVKSLHLLFDTVHDRA